MSCQLRPIAKIDIDHVRKHGLWSEVPGTKTDKFDDSSGTDNTQETASELSNLNESFMSLSPSGEILAVASKKSLFILSSKWDSHEVDEIKVKYKLTWKGDPCHNQSEYVTAVMCLPLISQGKTSRSAHSSEQCSVDWTCIAVGFNSGHLRFYDEGGSLLLSEQLHDEPITYLKCQSYHPSRTASYEDFPEEVYVTFLSTVASIPGFALFQTLRACRNQLARVQGNAAEAVTPPPLAFKKWAFTDQERLRDCEVIGPASSDTFDHLMTASIQGGFNACYRAGAPKSTLVIAAGRGPFVGFHYALEGVESRSVLTDVALAVTSKFRGWLRGGSKGNEKRKENILEPPESMACRFGICDLCREAEHIVRSPNREFSAVTDTLGRITLVSNVRGIVVRMWKGYRKAQCGWLQVEEEEPSVKGHNKSLLRTVLFLIIYDPKKGMLEVWPAPQGPRIAAFSCSKKGRLLYTSHGLVGLNNVAVKWANKSFSPCVYIDPMGTIAEIVVPFHCALSDASSERAADLALLRKLRTVLREAEIDEERLAQEVGLIAAELKTSEIRSQTLAMLTANRHITPDALEGALAVFMDRVVSEEPSRVESAERTLLLSSQQLRNLIGLYKFVHQQRERPPNYMAVVPQQGVSELQSLSKDFSLSNREATALKSLLSTVITHGSTQSSPRREARVTFREGPKKSAFVDFVGCFDIGKQSSYCQPGGVCLKKKLPSEKLNSLADLLFQGILYSEYPVEVWQAEAACCGIFPTNLLQLAVHFWLNRNMGRAVETEMKRFSDIVEAICMLEEVNNDNMSAPWGMVRRMLIESYCPFNALTAAVVCRSVAVSIEKNHAVKKSKSSKQTSKHREEKKDVAMEVDISTDNTEKQSMSEDDSVGSKEDNISRKSSGGAEWEHVSLDTAQWSLLIGRLEDVALLDTVLGQDPGDMFQGTDKTPLPRLSYEKPKVSLFCLLQKGKGAVSEYVAKWLTSSGLDPKLLTETTDVEWTEKYRRSLSSVKRMELDEPPPEDKSEDGIVREGVPLVTEQGMEASSLAGGHARIFEDIHLLKAHFPYSLSGSVLIANLGWELMLIWHRTPDRIDVLKGALQCLQTVPCVHVRQGLCCLIWTNYLRQRLETAAQIMNISSGNPKEKLCRKELEMSEPQVSEFTEICLQFLDTFIEASSMSEVTHPPGADAAVNSSEDLWDYHIPDVDGVMSTAIIGAPALTVLALHQPQAQFDQLHLLFQLALTSHMILFLNLKGQQLTPLFSSTEWQVFFSDLAHPHHVAHHTPETRLTNSRTQFLMRAVTSALQSVIASDPIHLTDMTGGLRADMSAAMQWMGKCQELAHIWHINTDPLRRHQVCLLYTAGHDLLAEEILPAVSSLDVLASQLLLIAGQRVKLLLEKSTNLHEKMSNLDPALTSWLFELNTQGVRQVQLLDTAQLATHVIQHLPESHPETPLAVLLYEALQALLTSEDD